MTHMKKNADSLAIKSIRVGMTSKLLRLLWDTNLSQRLFTTCIFLFTMIDPATSFAISPNEEEIQHAKRITELWKDKETELVITQIEAFVKDYPNSIFQESLLVILGNSYWMNKNYNKALNVYEAIQTQEFQDRVLKNKLDSLINTGNFERAITELQPRVLAEGIKPISDEEHIYIYYYAEALMQSAKKTSSTKKRELLYNTAEKRFASLSDSTYEINANEGMAVLSACRGNAARASEIYFALATKFPDQKQVFLYKGAKMLMKVDPEEALLKLSEAQKLQGPHQSELTLHKAQLLFNLGHHSHVIEEFIDMRDVVSKEHLPLLTYFVGKSLYLQKKYKKSLATLEPLAINNFTFIAADNTKQDIYTHIIACSYYIDDVDRGNYWLNEYEKKFTNDDKLAKALYHKAYSLVKNDDKEEALALLELIVWKYPHFYLIDKVEYQRNIMQFSLNQWQVARYNFIAYAEKYPESTYTPIVTKKIPYCTQKMILQARNRGEETEALYRLFLEDLKLITHNPKVATKKSKPLLVLAECEALCELKQYKKAFPKLTMFTKAFSKHPEIYRAHLLLGQCYLKEAKNNRKFITHGELAISISDKALNNGSLRLKLFNAYIKELQKNSYLEVDQKLSELKIATDHLKQAFLLHPEGISIENRIWLANQLIKDLESNIIDYVFEPLSKKEEKEIATIAASVYESIYEFNYLPEIKPKYVNKYKPSLDDYFQMAKLYGWLDHSNKTIRALDHYILNMNNNKSDEKYLEALYILGQVHEKNKNSVKALSNYNELLSLKKITPKLEFAAKFHRTSIELNEIPATQRNTENSKAVALLNQLKNLQIHKNIKTEPIHIEAALKRSIFESKFSPSGKQQAALLQLLKETKKDFVGTDNISAKDYHTSRKKLPGKGKIYQSYMMYIDGYISFLESKLATSRKEVRWKKEAAKNIFENIIKSDEGKTSFITKNVNEALESLQNE